MYHRKQAPEEKVIYVSKPTDIDIEILELK